MRDLESYARSILRIVAGLLFTCHGLQKLVGMFGGMGGKGAVAAFPSLFWWAAVLECAGGLLIVIGLFTRPVAFLLCGEMAVAYFRAHAPRGVWPIQNGGELAVLYCFIYLYLLAAGAGPISLDRLVSAREEERSLTVAARKVLGWTQRSTRGRI
jgi:putative oxidoreductase